MNPEFSRASVATLIAAIIGSVQDPEDGVPGSHRSSPLPPGEAPPDALERLSSLFRHYDYRVAEIGELGIPDWLWKEFRDLRWMLEETSKHQLSFGPSRDRGH